ncbi:cation:proton antiporter [Streptomyces sp. NPDC097981]|uniref:cation:proton antiporter n=1 Tax=Streptomyces sp. NPDC097981 TaxID=3155428 RepID=UPI00331EDAFC
MHRPEAAQDGTRRKAYTALLVTVLLPVGLVVGVAVWVRNKPFRGGIASSDAPFLDTAGHFFLGVAVVLSVSHMMGWLASKLGQPRVTGEIAAGILLGPSFLVKVAPDVAGWVFPATVLPLFSGLAQLGLVLFMFGVGQELASMQLRGAARRAVMISQASLLVPFAVGTLAALPLMDQYMADGVRPLAFVLFIGCALSITAFPVLARILHDLRLSRTRPGQLSLFAAAVGDGGSWLALSVILALAHGNAPTAVLGSALAALAVAAVFLGPLRRLMARWPDRGSAPGNAPTITLFLVVFIGVSATLTASLGIHQLIGALLVGLVWPRHHKRAMAAAAPLAATAKTVLLPFFFLGFGLTVDLSSLHLDGSAGVALLCLLAAATAGKVFGPSLCAWLTGLPRGEALTLGVLLNARGLTELVVLQIGYEAHIINEKMLGLLTVVALVTTLMTTPMLQFTGIRPDAQLPPLPVKEPVPPASAAPAESVGAVS